jgi:hypothetical protein
MERIEVSSQSTDEADGYDDFGDVWCDDEDRGDDGESALESMARLAADIEAGNAEPYPGWKLDRPQPGVLVWTTPSGRRYASDLRGHALPLSRSIAAYDRGEP